MVHTKTTLDLVPVDYNFSIYCVIKQFPVDIIPAMLYYVSRTYIRKKGGENMAKGKACRPSAKVSKAGRTLSTSKSKSAKSQAGATLANHKNACH